MKLLTTLLTVLGSLFLLTRQEYIKIFGGSRQSVHNRIKRKSLQTVMAPTSVVREMIVVDDAVYEKAVKGK